MLELQNITKIYHPGSTTEHRLFENFSLTVEDGQFVSIVGSNGSGKTSLTEAACYLTGQLDRLGRVADGNTVSDFDPEEVRRQVSVSTSLVPVEWKGTTTELYTQLKLDSISVPAFGKHLAQNCDFMAGRGIVFTRIRTREGSILSLSKAE